MKRFLKIVSFFAIALFLLAVCFDFFISYKLRKSPHREFVVWNEIIYDSIEADAIIMGSSRAWVQYSPQILDSITGLNFYNLGMDGSAFNRQIMRYDCYCSFQEKPQLIVQNIDFFSFLGNTQGYEREQFFPFWYNVEFRKCVINESFTFCEKMLPFFRYYGYGEVIKHSLGFKTQHFDYPQECNLYKGYKGQKKVWNGKKLAELTKIDISYNDQTMRMFSDYVRNVKEENIDLIFVFAPVYIGATEKVVDFDKAFAWYDSIANKYDVPILDYTFSPISYDTAYFYNATHLNETGAELLSTQLAHDLDSLKIFKK